MLIFLKQNQVSQTEHMSFHSPMQLDLWKTSGHYDFYRDSMFNQMEIDTEEYQARGCSCVGRGQHEGSDKCLYKNVSCS